MVWEIVKREDHFQGSNKPFISITVEHIRFNALFTRIAQLENNKFVILHVDPENLKLGFEFCNEERQGVFKLSKNEGRPGLFCAGKGIIQQYPWLLAVAKLNNIQERRFEPTKEGKLWIIQLCPAFEIKKPRDSNEIPSDLCGIYRYLRENSEIVYIGKGNIKERLNEPQRKDWDFSMVEYSKVNDIDQQLKWEYYWIERYKAEHNGNRPFYNKISGIDKD